MSRLALLLAVAAFSGSHPLDRGDLAALQAKLDPVKAAFATAELVKLRAMPGDIHCPGGRACSAKALNVLAHRQCRQTPAARWRLLGCRLRRRANVELLAGGVRR